MRQRPRDGGLAEGAHRLQRQELRVAGAGADADQPPAHRPGLATELGTTRSAAALELWRDRLAGALVAVGNAPTALFHLLEMLAAGAPRPAAVIGMPVGFVGAAESKAALAEADPAPWAIVEGRMGGSAMAAAAVNALARPGL